MYMSFVELEVEHYHLNVMQIIYSSIDYTIKRNSFINPCTNAMHFLFNWPHAMLKLNIFYQLYDNRYIYLEKLEYGQTARWKIEVIDFFNMKILIMYKYMYIQSMCFFRLFKIKRCMKESRETWVIILYHETFLFNGINCLICNLRTVYLCHSAVKNVFYRISEFSKLFTYWINIYEYFKLSFCIFCLPVL